MNGATPIAGRSGSTPEIAKPARRGPVIAGAIVVMLLILSITMLAAVPFALAAGLDADPAVSKQLVAFVILFSVHGGIATRLLARARRRLGVVTASWLRRGWWPGNPGPSIFPPGQGRLVLHWHKDVQGGQTR